jgi:2-polyprenyl-3-methyl-5-hydroxy-6-metoxy-1,4-benzoquinol methylase
MRMNDGQRLRLQLARPAEAARDRMRRSGRALLAACCGVSFDQILEPDMRPYEQLFIEASRDGRVLKRHNIYGSGPPVDDLSREAIELVTKYVAGSVLDFGAGCGALQRFLPAGCRYTGIELNADAVKIAERLGRKLIHGDATKTDFKDDAFDVCVMLEVLEHIDDYETVLTETARLAPRLVLTVPNIEVIPEMSADQVVPWHLLEATHVNFFTPGSLKKTLQRYYRSVEVWEINAWYKPGLHMNIAAVANR